MSGLSAKDNFDRVLSFADPEYTPFGLEATLRFFHRDALFFDGNGDPDAVSWRDAWGVGFKWSDELNRFAPYPISHPIEDVRALEDFSWPDPGDPGIMEKIAPEIERVDRKENSVIVWNPGFMFVRSWLLLGMENLLASMLTEPEAVEYLLDKIESYQTAIAKNYIQLGIDMVEIGDDAGTTKSLMMSPELWRRFIKPRLKRIFDIYKNAGVTVLFHCCGRIMEILDDIIEIGTDILNPLQAGANDLLEVRRKTAGKVVLYGGIDAHTVMTKSPSRVAALTEEVLHLLGRDGGYIAAPDQELPFPKANMDALRETVRRLGRLPCAARA